MFIGGDKCDSCKMNPIKVESFKCLICSDYDLCICENCKLKGGHCLPCNDEHLMEHNNIAGSEYI